MLIHLQHFRMQIIQCTDQHLFSFSRKLHLLIPAEAEQRFQHIRCDVSAARHAVVPAPRAIGQLQSLQLLLSHSQFIIHVIEIKQRSQALHLCRFTLRLKQPGRFLRQQILQFLILQQVTYPRILVAPHHLPGIHCLTNTRLLLHEVRRHGIGIIRRCPRNGIVRLRVAHRRQRLNGIPSRVRRKLHRQLARSSRLATLVKQIRQTIFLFLAWQHRNGQRLGHILLIGKHRNHMLFTVAKILTLGHQSTAQQVIPIRCREGELHRHTLLGFRGKWLLLRSNHLIRQRVEPSQRHHTRQCTLRTVIHRSRQHRMVTYPHKTR